MAQPFRRGELSKRDEESIANALSRMDERDGKLIIEAATNQPVRASKWSSIPGAGILASNLARAVRALLGGRKSTATSPLPPRQQLLPPALPGTVSRTGLPPIVREPLTTTIAEPDPIQPDTSPMDWEFVVGSSNVYALRYDEDALHMYVCFLGGTSQNRNGEGPTYRYKGVPKKVATRLFDSHSVGVAVWDELRIRGTIAGHQYDYNLEATGPSGYVPRKATERGYKPRQIKQGTMELRSSKPGTGRFAGE